MNKKGFTLIELLIVIAIICILLAVAASEYKDYKEKVRDARGGQVESVVKQTEEVEKEVEKYPVIDHKLVGSMDTLYRSVPATHDDVMVYKIRQCDYIISWQINQIIHAGDCSNPIHTRVETPRQPIEVPRDSPIPKITPEYGYDTGY